MSFNLYHSLSGRDVGRAPNVVLLHGLFGSGNNLGALARALRDDYCVYSVDLPNHGKSDWLAPADIPTMADSVVRWMDQQGLQHSHFIGHSLGGKIAMQLALHDPSRVTSLCVADIAPVHYPPRHDAVLQALNAVALAQCESRSEAAEIMAQFLQEEMVIQFLLMSLRRNAEGVYQWRFNLNGIAEDYGLIRDAPEAGQPYTANVMFIKGEDSDYILPEHRDSIISLFPAATLKIMPGCGHWLHAQQPQLFNRIVLSFLAAQID